MAYFQSLYPQLVGTWAGYGRQGTHPLNANIPDSGKKQMAASGLSGLWKTPSDLSGLWKIRDYWQDSLDKLVWSGIPYETIVLLVCFRLAVFSFIVIGYSCYLVSQTYGPVQMSSFKVFVGDPTSKCILSFPFFSQNLWSPINYVLCISAMYLK